MQQLWLTQRLTVRMKHGVMSMTIDIVPMGTRLAVSLHRRNAAKNEIGMTEICVTSSTVEMHVAGLKTDARRVSTLNRSSVKKGTMTTTVPITINLTDSVLPKEGVTQEESKPFPMT
jgi:hypothetical protein